MSIPASYLETLRDQVSIAETIGRRLAFDPSKSTPGKGEHWACCPFHGEKTPSFHVVDRKGYFYCFGCHEKGSAIDFVMKFDRLNFLEAVEVLAAEAGLPPPVRDAREAKRHAARASLSEATEAAVAFFQEQLASAGGRAAREYLSGRGLTEETIERFELGFAPDRRDAALQTLRAEGFDREVLVGADICSISDRDGGVYDRFRNRIMFPIRDKNGRYIGFGGRAMSADAKAKYLNSRETELFKKGRTLYNFNRARLAVAEDRPLVVVEGYMDVLALAQSGYETAVAPLGTALTEAQLDMLWSAAAEPVLALDGDEAGLRAAQKAADLATPRLQAGKSLCFVTLPIGKDPDDVARDGGAPAVEAIMAQAEPLIDVIWRRTTDDVRVDTPERRAGLEAAHRAIVDQIQDAGVRRKYGDALWERRLALFRREDRKRRGDEWRREALRRDGPTQATRLRAAEEAAESQDPGVLREGAIILLLLESLDLLEQRFDVADELDFIDPALDSVKNALLCGFASLEEKERGVGGDEIGSAARQAALRAYVDERCGAGLCAELCERLKKRLGGPFTGPLEPPGAVRRIFDELASLHRAQLTWRREVEAYKSELLEAQAEEDDAEPHRLQEAQKRLLRNQGQAEEGDPEGSNPSDRLKAILASKPWEKRKRRGPGAA